VYKKPKVASKIPRFWLGLILLLIIGQAGCSLFKETKLTLTWTTESELDIIGFNVYRADSLDGEFIKLNNELIPPAVDPFIGGEHAYVDEGVVRGTTYFYQLETVDRNGNVTRSDIVDLTAGQ
jgi:hypothetical protein